MIALDNKDTGSAIAHQLVAPSGKSIPIPQLLSVNQIAMGFNLSTRSIWRLVSKGDLPQPINLGSARRWYTADVENYLQKLTKKRDVIASRRGGGRAITEK